MIAKRSSRSSLCQWLLLLSLLSPSPLIVNGLVVRESSLFAWNLQQRPSSVLHNSMDEDSEFWNLYNEQAAEFGMDMATEFQWEQASRTERLEQQRQTLERLEDSSTKSSAGFFASRRPTTRSVPTITKKTGTNDPWTTKSSSNGDNLLLIMTMSMTTTVTQQSQPIMISLAVLLLCLPLSFYFAVGDESPLMSMSHEVALLSPKTLALNALD